MLPMMLLLIAFAGFAVLPVQAFAKRTGKVLPQGIMRLLENSAAIYELAAFIVKADTALIFICTLLQVSNHLIITLEIVYLFSALILVLFNKIKQSSCLRCREI